MALPQPGRLLAAIDATWPPAEIAERAGWQLRRGAGGGKRVSAASRIEGGAPVPDIAVAVEALGQWDQPPLFRIGPEDAALDAVLAEEGHARIDPVVLYAAPVEALTDAADETARVIRISTPVAMVEEIWAAGGIGPGRLAVMARVTGASITLLARQEDRPVGVAFCACDGELAMLHAVEVLAERRRMGGGLMLLRGAANWSAESGARILALAVTEANGAARALYERAGMVAAGAYHYRGR
ncbi:MAG: GNAT family N-acetyltransferase [Pseudomonadota bacterium]